jgi:hypothetical protein
MPAATAYTPPSRESSLELSSESYGRSVGGHVMSYRFSKNLYFLLLSLRDETCGQRPDGRT